MVFAGAMFARLLTPRSADGLPSAISAGVKGVAPVPEALTSYLTPVSAIVASAIAAATVAK